MTGSEAPLERLLAAADWPEGAELLDADPDRRYWALDQLAATAFMRHVTDEATVRMTPVVLALLADPRLDDTWTRTSFEERVPLRAGLLELLGNAAYGASWGGTAEELRAKAALLAAGREEDLVRPGDISDLIAAEEAPHRLWLREHAGEVLDAVLPYLDAGDPRIVQAALYPAAWFGVLAPAPLRAAVRERLLTVVEASSGPRAVQVTAVLGLLTLDVDTTPLLTHPALPVRAAAALSPATSGDPRAAEALQEALRDSPDDWVEPLTPLLQRSLSAQFAETVAAGR